MSILGHGCQLTHRQKHYGDAIMSTMASQITSFPIVCSVTDQRKHQSSASLAFVRGIQWRPVNSSHKGPVTQKMFPFDDVIMKMYGFHQININCTNITKYTVEVLDRNPSEKCSGLIHSLCPTSMISYQCLWGSACLATEGTWQWGYCMQIWCTGSFSSIHHPNVSLDANFVHPAHELQTKTHIATKHPDDIVFLWCSF